MDPILLDRQFRVWGYGVSHSQLLLHAGADAAHLDYLNVLFEDVRAVKLRSSYQPLILGAAGNSVRNDILDFADMPQRHRHRYLFDVLNRTGGRVRPVRACDHSGCGQDERPTPTVPGPTELV